MIAGFLNHQQYFLMHSCTISKTTSLVTTFRVFTNQLASRTSPTRIFVPPKTPTLLQGCFKECCCTRLNLPMIDKKGRCVAFLKHHTVSCMEGKRPCTAWVGSKASDVTNIQFFLRAKNTLPVFVRSRGRFLLQCQLPVFM